MNSALTLTPVLAIFAALGAACAFLIAFLEYQHHFPRGLAVRHSLEVAAFAFVALLSLSLLGIVILGSP